MDLLADGEALLEMRKRHYPITPEELTICKCREREKCDVLRVLHIVDGLWEMIGQRNARIDELDRRVNEFSRIHTSA